MSEAARTTPAPAMRAATPGWRDPRLWVGVAIVAASVVAGARILASADHTVQVWAATSDLGAGARIDVDDLEAHRVRFADADDLDGYFTVSDELPADLELTRPIGAGELVPRAAVGSVEETGTVRLPIAVDDELVPPSVTSGSVVNVYLVADAPAGTSGTAGTAGTAGSAAPGAAGRPVLAAVTVVDAPALAETFGTTGRRQLVLAVSEADASSYLSTFARLDDPVITVAQAS